VVKQQVEKRMLASDKKEITNIKLRIFYFKKW